jgi:hypothetical protein
VSHLDTGQGSSASLRHHDPAHGLKLIQGESAPDADEAEPARLNWFGHRIAQRGNGSRQAML